jgi:hypothetical protein
MISVTVKVFGWPLDAGDLSQRKAFFFKKSVHSSEWRLVKTGISSHCKRLSDYVVAGSGHCKWQQTSPCDISVALNKQSPVSTPESRDRK